MFRIDAYCDSKSNMWQLGGNNDHTVLTIKREQSLPLIPDHAAELEQIKNNLFSEKTKASLIEDRKLRLLSIIQSTEDSSQQAQALKLLSDTFLVPRSKLFGSSVSKEALHIARLCYLHAIKVDPQVQLQIKKGDLALKITSKDMIQGISNFTHAEINQLKASTFDADLPKKLKEKQQQQAQAAPVASSSTSGASSNLSVVTTAPLSSSISVIVPPTPVVPLPDSSPSALTTSHSRSPSPPKSPGSENLLSQDEHGQWLVYGALLKNGNDENVENALLKGRFKNSLEKTSPERVRAYSYYCQHKENLPEKQTEEHKQSYALYVAGIRYIDVTKNVGVGLLDPAYEGGKFTLYLQADSSRTLIRASRLTNRTDKKQAYLALAAACVEGHAQDRAEAFLLLANSFRKSNPDLALKCVQESKKLYSSLLPQKNELQINHLPQAEQIDILIDEIANGFGGSLSGRLRTPLEKIKISNEKVEVSSTNQRLAENAKKKLLLKLIQEFLKTEADFHEHCRRLVTTLRKSQTSMTGIESYINVYENLQHNPYQHIQATESNLDVCLELIQEAYNSYENQVMLENLLQASINNNAFVNHAEFKKILENAKDETPSLSGQSKQHILSNYPYAPYQRAGRYELLFRDMGQYTEGDDVAICNSLYSQAKSFVSVLNEQVRVHEGIENLLGMEGLNKEKAAQLAQTIEMRMNFLKSAFPVQSNRLAQEKQDEQLEQKIANIRMRKEQVKRLNHQDEKIALLSSDLEVAQQETVVAQTQLAEMRSELQREQINAATLTGRLEASEDTNNQLQILFDNAVKENLTLSAKNADLEAKAYKSEESLRSLEKTVEELKKEMQCAENLAAGLAAEKRALLERNAALENALEAPLKKVAEQQSALEQMVSQNAKLQADNQELNTQLAALNLKITEQATAFENAQKATGEKLSVLENENAKFRSDMVDFKQQIEDLKAKRSDSAERIIASNAESQVGPTPHVVISSSISASPGATVTPEYKQDSNAAELTSHRIRDALTRLRYEIETTKFDLGIFGGETLRLAGGKTNKVPAGMKKIHDAMNEFLAGTVDLDNMMKKIANSIKTDYDVIKRNTNALPKDKEVEPGKFYYEEVAKTKKKETVLSWKYKVRDEAGNVKSDIITQEEMGSNVFDLTKCLAITAQRGHTLDRTLARKSRKSTSITRYDNIHRLFKHADGIKADLLNVPDFDAKSIFSLPRSGSTN